MHLIIPILIFLAVVSIGGALLMSRYIRKRLIQERLQRVSNPLPSDIKKIKSRTYEKVLHSVGKTVAPKISKTLRDRMTHAGFYGVSAPQIFIGAEVLLILLGLTLATALLLPLNIMLPLKIIGVLMAGMAGMIAPGVYVSMKRSKRIADINNHLPDAVDLLEICIGAGMGADMAWNSVTEQIRRISPTLADEMALVDMEVHLGAPRATAMRHMADRAEADDLAILATAFLQSEKFGTSLSETMRIFSKSIRETRGQRAEEAAEQMAVRILFPLILFIFPTILLVCAGPAAIKIAAVLNQ